MATVSKKTHANARQGVRPPAGRNRTLQLQAQERTQLLNYAQPLHRPTPPSTLLNRIICQDALTAIRLLPADWADLLFLDPPYNLRKNFNGSKFQPQPAATYARWLTTWLAPLARTLKATASVYICADWRTSSIVHEVAGRYFHVRNRITWEREKGRGARTNWKNCTEDIWFCTVSDRYTFNVEAVKLKRKIIAPYTDTQGKPKDWQRTRQGKYRLTHASNIWTDLTVPFWSMPENTPHPTQKPEKLLAKLILASTRPGDVVLDPFVGSGTAAVVAKKLGRKFVGIERDADYCCLTLKRLAQANVGAAIQGYADGVFWERNSSPPPQPPVNTKR